MKKKKTAQQMNFTDLLPVWPEPGNAIGAWRHFDPRDPADKGTIWLTEQDDWWGLTTPVNLDLPPGWCVDREQEMLRDALGIEHRPQTCVDNGWVRVVG